MFIAPPETELLDGLVVTTEGYVGGVDGGIGKKPGEAAGTEGAPGA
jgi:hypothetical protein